MKRESWIILSIILVLLIILGSTVIKNGSVTGEVIEDGKSALIDGEKTSGEIISIPTEEPKIEEVAPVKVVAKIVNFAFLENTIEINAGDTVIWENRDDTRHTITSDSGSELNSRLLSKGEKYSHTFNTVGTYNYHCTPHPYMKGKVIVK